MKTKITFFLLLLSASFSYGQNCDCSELLKYGIYNHFSSTENFDNYNEIQKAVSSSYTKGDSEGGGGNVGYAGITAGYSKSESSMLQKITSNQTLEKSDVEKLKSESASFVSSEMMSSYRECLRLCENSGLQSGADFPTDGRFSSISFTLEYTKPKNVTRVPELNSINIGPNENCFNCVGNLVELANQQGKIVENKLYKMTCTRKIEDTPFNLPGTNKQVYATEAHLSIQTDMGDYDLRIPPLFAKNPEFEKGLGEIVTSLLTKEKFIETYGNDWMLADGSLAPSGSDYRKYVDKYLPHMNGKVPNLSGSFIRGFNNGSEINPANKKLGEFQDDAFQGHKHFNPEKTPAYFGGKNTDWDREVANAATKSEESEGKFSANSTFGEPRISSETRPKNVTVNYFIKIN